MNIVKDRVTIKTFCDLNDISRATFYKLKKATGLPKTHKINALGNLTFIHKDDVEEFNKSVMEAQHVS